jgi:nucleotide-binding universal stress UspA family protein
VLVPIEGASVPRPILIGYDPRHADRAPVDFGVAVARSTGASLIIACVQAQAPVLPVSAGQSLAYAVVDDDLMVDAEDALNALEAELSSLGIQVEVRRLRGTSAARVLHLTAEQEDVGLMVVGSDRRSGAGRVRAGSTAGRLLHGAPCPVAVVPRDWTNGGRGAIGVAYVDTEEGRDALRGAYALARRIRATLRAITVVKPSLTMYSETEPRTPARQGKDVEDVEGEHRLVAERALCRAVEELEGDVAVEVEALVGDPVVVLVSVSEHLDLLVCGSRGYGPVRAVLLGSVSGPVMAGARCPVLVVPRGVKTSLEALVRDATGAATPA